MAAGKFSLPVPSRLKSASSSCEFKAFSPYHSFFAFCLQAFKLVSCAAVLTAITTRQYWVSLRVIKIKGIFFIHFCLIRSCSTLISSADIVASPVPPFLTPRQSFRQMGLRCAPQTLGPERRHSNRPWTAPTPRTSATPTAAHPRISVATQSEFHTQALKLKECIDGDTFIVFQTSHRKAIMA